MITCVTHSKSETLKGTGSPCHYISYLVEDGPLCRHRIHATRVIFDHLAHFNLIMIMCNLFCPSLSSVMVFNRGFPRYICLWKNSTWLFAQGFHKVWRHGENLKRKTANRQFTRPHALCIALRPITSHVRPTA